MKSHRSAFYGHLGLTVILAVLCLSARNPGFAQEGRQAHKVGIVDIGAAFNQYAKKTRLENQLNAMRRGFVQQYKAERLAIRQLNQQLAQAEGQAREDLEFEIEVRVERSRIAKRRGDQRLKERLQAMTVELLRDIDRAIKRYGKEKKYAFILRLGGPDAGDASAKGQLFQFQTQTAAYHDAALDVTADIVARLNQKEAR